ncbi:ATP-sensitive inward rectifier potassium channel 11-like isoform X2 [Rhodnius prolixus]|uniref:ATP-sensitive inward rectifier potassium channel 11-like isoform X2 n=1 Tax=Rhodnius prolixus TaxID=13249 RepID=UPI003D18B100
MIKRILCLRSIRSGCEEERGIDSFLEPDYKMPFLSQDIGRLPFIRNEYKRSVRKTGLCNIRKRRRAANLNHYATDMFTSLVDSRWRYILLIYSLSFVSTWFLFALLWWVIAYAHGDLDTSPYKSSGEPCVTLVDDLLSAFLFSLETQYTTGYGTRSPTDECPEAVFLLCVQGIFGMLHQSVMVGVVFAKLSRPKGRCQAIMFSEKAVICLRDGNLCLMFRLADERKSHVIDCKIHAWILQHRVSPEGEVLVNYQKKLNISVDDAGSEIFLLWPVTVVHRIDYRSPLYDLSAMDLFHSKFEIVVSLVCTAEATGQTAEARCSYTPNEILWGHRFKTLITREGDGVQVDYSQFDKTVSVDTALCSSRQLNSWSQCNSPLTPSKKFPFFNIHSDSPKIKIDIADEV